MNFWYKLNRFMSGRYGIDKLFYVIFAVAAVISVVNIFVRNYFLQIIVYALVVYAVFRVLSRNYEARRRENRWVETCLNDIKHKRDVSRQRNADFTHVYKKCPNCKAVLRLPRRIGKHTTVCPKCNTSFKVTVRK